MLLKDEISSMDTIYDIAIVDCGVIGAKYLAAKRSGQNDVTWACAEGLLFRIKACNMA